MGEALFSRKSVARYTEPQELRLADGSVITARVYNEENPEDNYTLYTVGEIEVNQALRENLSKLPLSTNDGTNDFDIENRMVLRTTAIGNSVNVRVEMPLINKLSIYGPSVRFIRLNEKGPKGMVKVKRTTLKFR